MRPFLVLFLLAGCTPDASDRADGPPPDFTVRPGVEVATILDGEPGEALTLYDDADTPLITLLADELGQAHFSYVGDELLTIDTADGMSFPVLDGTVLRPGRYTIRNDEADRWSGEFEVIGLDDLPDPSLYEEQVLTGVPSSPLTGELGDPQEGFQYVEVRDGTLLSVMIRFPDPAIYGDGPYPTVIEYSGYSPSRPDRASSTLLAMNALGYATVGVNMRGTGCSGGVFDVFNRAQHADGYDVIETVARQDWVLNNQVGMVGVSYPGISQLYVASTAPPSLGAIVPVSVIADSWQMQWPGGIYNNGFTRSWVEQRNREAEAGGASWVVEQREATGDATCEENVRLSAQNIEFESFLRGLEFRPRDADDRDLTKLVRQIESPVFLAGAWQDEQTGALFGAMLDRFDKSEDARFLLYNGRHPDGFSPNNVFWWHEFLEFYVAGRVPELPALLRTNLGAEAFTSEFGITEYSFPEDRFGGMDYAAALADYQQEAPVTVVFDSGGGGLTPGEPLGVWEHSFTSWPSPEAVELSFFPGPDGGLYETAPAVEGADRWLHDPEAGSDTFFGPAGYQLLEPLWDIDWQPFAEGDVASYLSEPFAEDVVLAGPGIATLFVRTDEPEADVQVTLTEVRPDGQEVLVQSGWLRLGHRAADELAGLRLDRPFTEEAYQPVPAGQWVEAPVNLPAFAHAFRAGSQLRVAVSSPGRNHGTWEFEPPAYEGIPSFDLGWGPGAASEIRLVELPQVPVVGGLPPCPGLRGQPCRAYEPVANIPAG